ncbi:SGNH/GDSL hydrolase family protein [Massilia atriviolacea]|uniref:SGNH/GDSL hydrolase family protein n=1 Tax=Massilia atriviolacea TaxID=2495579 RepID=A0A430HR89_9BURK|nr:SGNH/GDSL hydrolase family protein [Massilia atriviolacea]RSZ60034.1 SGNH/GDSL hydrolase family protein [Massilia atriviolacea]
MTISIPAATISQPVAAGRGSIVAVSPDSGASAVVEYTTADAAAVANGVAKWAIWSKGTVGASASDLLGDNVFIRVTATGGAVALDIDSHPSTASLAAYRADWSSADPWATTITRNEALSRIWGVSGTGGVLHPGVNQSPSNFTSSMKMEMEAPFYAVRLLRINRSAANSLDAQKALIGVTGSNAIDTSYGLTVSQNLTTPVINGVSYAQLAPAGTANGFQPVIWPGREVASLTNSTTTATLTTKLPHGLITGAIVTVRNVDLPAYNVTNAAVTVTSTTAFTYTMGADPGAAATVVGSYTANMVGVLRPNVDQTYAQSEKTYIKSVPRLDGSGRPLLLIRLHCNGTVYPFPFHTMSAVARTPSTALRGRTYQMAYALSDAVATPNTLMGLAGELLDVYPVVSYSVPVISIWGVGDSTMQNDALVTDKISSWMYRACLNLSTPQKPIVYANFGASSQNSLTYWNQAKAALAAGAPAPSIMVIGMDSVNDGVNTDGTIINAFGFAEDVISTAKKYGIGKVVMCPRMPLNTLTAPQYALKVAQDIELSKLAAAYGIEWMPLPGLGDGANPERWATALNYAADGYHPNEACIESPLSTTATAFISNLLRL